MGRDTVLIIDGNEADRLSLRRILASEYEVVEAEDEYTCLSTLDELYGSVKLVILGMSAPGQDGFGVLATMRKRMPINQVPIMVAISDKADVPETALLSMGAANVLHKPYVPQDTLRKVRDVCKRYESDQRKNRAVYAEAEKHSISLLNLMDAFAYEHNHANDTSYIDPFYKNWLHDNWDDFRIDRPECVRTFVYRPDYQRFRDFLQDNDSNDYDTIDIRLTAISGEYEWFRLGKLRYNDESGLRTVLTFKNISSEMKVRKRLEFLVKNDPLTQIPNLFTFTESTSRLLEKLPDIEFVMICMGVEQLSAINQIFGRTEADQLLRYIAVKLQENVEGEENGTYCHVSSSSFAACIPNDAESVDRFISFMQEALNMYPIQFDVKFSFGLFVITDRDATIDSMLTKAITAQKTVIGNYRRHVATYDVQMSMREEVERMIVLEMEEALEKRQFEMYLQPKCDMRTGEVIGSEALARWNHPKLGMIPPASFIPVFEKNGFITELDRYILEEACGRLREWVDSGMTVLPISVNISRVDLYNPHLVDDILQMTDRYGIPHSLIEFELTESSFVFDNTKISALTELLKSNGFCVLMDDFGSGYSSLTALKDIRVNILKIDQKFLQDSETDERADKILQSVINMARAINLEVIVEGVETEKQAEFLLSIGARLAQGFLYYKPMTAGEYKKLIAE